MIKLLLLLIMIVFCGSASAAPSYKVPYTRAQEKDVESFITIGMDERAVVGKFGPPNQANIGKDGFEVLRYLADPRVVRETHSKYAGFEVFFKDKKVTHFGVIKPGQN
jgi:hypothetical protein